MAVTPIGMLIVSAAFILLLLPKPWLWGFAIFVLPFQAAAIITIGGDDQMAGISPVYFILILATARDLVFAALRGDFRVPIKVLNVYAPALLFFLWSAATALIWPRLFAGQITVVAYYGNGNELQVSSSNIIHSLYLLICVSSSFMISLAVSRSNDRVSNLLMRAYIAASIVAGAFIIYHALHLYFGMPFPLEFFYSNPSAAQNQFGMIASEMGKQLLLMRPSGTFSEPSYAAMYMVGFFGFVTAMYIHRKRSRLLLFGVVTTFLMVMLIGSSGGLIILALVTSYLVLNGIFSLLKLQGLKEYRKFFKPLGIIAICCILPLVVFTNILDMLSLGFKVLLLDKLQTGSGAERMATEYMALQVFVDSYGLGTGLGSNQSWTLPGYILSNTGMVGLLLLGWFALSVTKLAQRTLKELRSGGIEYGNIHAWLFSAVCLLLIGFICVPILLVPNIWIVIGILTGLSFRESNQANMGHISKADGCFSRKQHKPSLKPDFPVGHYLTKQIL
jgi:hypothetical protein